MSIAYINGAYLPLDDVKISPLDRGFLFGDGVYEVIASYRGKMVGFKHHIARLNQGLKLVAINLQWSIDRWRELCETLCSNNQDANLGIYIHVTRGADNKRGHAFPKNVTPTVLAFTFPISESIAPNRSSQQGLSCATAADTRWGKCNIKSISLLGNILHFQQGQESGDDEILLFNTRQELTECGACNVFIVKHGIISTPPLDQQILAGVTRKLLIDSIHQDGSMQLKERIISMDEVSNADEVWITSTTKEIAPIVKIDNKPVGDGEVGDIWEAATKLYQEAKFDL